MKSPIKIARSLAKRAKVIFESVSLSYPRKVQCNICGWEGRHFLSDPWHKDIICPRCRSDIRQRLFFAALQWIDNLSFDRILHNKKVLHFAPEDIVSSRILNKSAKYTTADFLRMDCDFQLDMSDMPEIANENFDVVIAFDVLEHVPNYKRALEEVHRILSSKGIAIFTVPQKDKLLVTYEDPAIVSPEDRERHYGQWDHLRIFGDDFPGIVTSKGFSVIAIDDSSFPEKEVRRHVLFPPELSKHPLATNCRKIFFCYKEH